jgi:hypothetical protein
MDVNLIIAVLGGLWLLFMVVALVRSIRAKHHKRAVVFGLPLVLVGAAALLWGV